MQSKKRNRTKKIVLLTAMVLLLLLILPGCVDGATDSSELTQPTRGAGTALMGSTNDNADKGIVEQLADLLGSRSKSVQIVALLTVLSLAPSLLMMLTSFTRIIIVLSFTRNALGVQQMPPNQVIVGLALFLTLFIMAPVVNEIKTDAYEPYVKNQITIQEAQKRAEEPLKGFMLRQTFKSDLNVFVELAKDPAITSVDNVPMRVLIPAFITSEIKRGFMIGFFIYIPFIVIDMIVASTLMAMGMMMLPPTVISLPFKVLLFILVDGWMLTVKTLITSFQ